MYVVAIGPFEHRELETLRDAADSCDLSLRTFDKAAEAVAMLPSLTEAPSGFFASPWPSRALCVGPPSPECERADRRLIEAPTEGQFRTICCRPQTTRSSAPPQARLKSASESSAPPTARTKSARRPATARVIAMSDAAARCDRSPTLESSGTS